MESTGAASPSKNQGGVLAELGTIPIASPSSSSSSSSTSSSFFSSTSTFTEPRVAAAPRQRRSSAPVRRRRDLSSGKRKKGSWPCQICGKVFTERGTLQVHQRVHTGEKPFKCHYCDRMFAQIGNRIKHERTHTGLRPYKCAICGRAFSQSNNCRRHMRIHERTKHRGVSPPASKGRFEKRSAAAKAAGSGGGATETTTRKRTRSSQQKMQRQQRSSSHGTVKVMLAKEGESPPSPSLPSPPSPSPSPAAAAASTGAATTGTADATAALSEVRHRSKSGGKATPPSASRVASVYASPHGSLSSSSLSPSRPYLAPALPSIPCTISSRPPKFVRQRSLSDSDAFDVSFSVSAMSAPNSRAGRNFVGGSGLGIGRRDRRVGAGGTSVRAREPQMRWMFTAPALPRPQPSVSMPQPLCGNSLFITGVPAPERTTNYDSDGACSTVSRGSRSSGSNSIGGGSKGSVGSVSSTLSSPLPASPPPMGYGAGEQQQSLFQTQRTLQKQHLQQKEQLRWYYQQQQQQQQQQQKQHQQQQHHQQVLQQRRYQLHQRGRPRGDSDPLPPRGGWRAVPGHYHHHHHQQQQQRAPVISHVPLGVSPPPSQQQKKGILI